VPGVPGGKTGHAVLVLSGPGKGQWRRVAGISGDRGRTIELDAPFDPPPTADSVLQVGPFRGQILIVGNHFVFGGGAQMYAACYDCAIAENRFDHFGFSNCEG
jgi:hypothetical protein